MTTDTKAPQHTALPWVLGGAGTIHNKAARYDEHGARHGDTPDRIARIEYPYGDDDGKEANAEFIVRAVNNHYQLIAVLAEIVGQEKPNPYGYDAAHKAMDDDWRARARAALREAGHVV
jgi:hypothetical protein